MLTLILGGARSGKSHMAQQLAKKAGLVTYVATAQAAGDHKMLSRITANATEVRRLGYIGIEDNGVKARGHEFHYSAIDPLPGCARRALPVACGRLPNSLCSLHRARNKK